ncbi:helix-turn-helix transcriptional regulator [Mariprofundus erugo]|uniref:winged helix-turn-helix transcriptional regulator n=1 Tax=Mariprofundus erugo TaxID=2528639 RepID=UPI0010FE855B|nr:helix-turn-helix domain-containing protein [Mariprofundus erugo]TLS75089.1 helix-turn-helix transcriptional regulator [Mariprofundus erugo]
MIETDTGVRNIDVVPSHGECKKAIEILARIGDKWTVMVVGVLARNDTLRYSELHRSIEGISQRMLTLTLKGLERDGLVERTIYPTIPPRVEYKLTDLGLSLIEPLRALHAWAVTHHSSILTAREAFDMQRVVPGT